jgi:hypothetical protein
MKFKHVKFKHPFILGLFLLIIVVLVSALIVHITQTRKNTPQPMKYSNTPFDGYGLYESCSPTTSKDCLSHLNVMAAAGFKLVINYGEMYGDASFQQAYLDRAQSVGMKVIVGLSNPTFYNGKDLRSHFPALAKTCNCTNNHSFIQYVVNLVKNHPAVWGYYIGDEVEPGDHDRMKSALADVVHQLDPKHPRLFIDTPGRSTATWRGNSPFFDTADVIGSDFYPVRGDPSDYPAIDQAGDVASGVQEYADTYKKDSAIVLQAFSYSQYTIPGTPYPTASQMESMLSQTLANAHPRIILWYSYDDTMAYSNAAQHWNDLKSTIARHMIKSTYQTQQ